MRTFLPRSFLFSSRSAAAFIATWNPAIWVICVHHRIQHWSLSSHDRYSISTMFSVYDTIYNDSLPHAEFCPFLLPFPHVSSHSHSHSHSHVYHHKYAGFHLYPTLDSVSTSIHLNILLSSISVLWLWFDRSPNERPTENHAGEQRKLPSKHCIPERVQHPIGDKMQCEADPIVCGIP